MKIKTRLKLNSFISLGVFILIMLSLAWSFREMSIATRNLDQVAEMRKAAFERIILRDDYLLNQEERARSQWYAKSEALRRLLESASEIFTSSHDQALLKEARGNFDFTLASFSKFMEDHEREKRSARGGFVFNEAESRLIGQVFIKAYALTDNLNRLYESAFKTRTTVRDRGLSAVIFSVIIGMLASIINTTLTNRILAKRIASLGRGVEIIGGGDLEYRIGVEGDDELSVLARASNDMAAKLGQSYTAITVLEKEIERRLRTEGTLRETSDYLDNLIGYANAPIIVWDPQFRITRFNNAFETLTGRKAADVIGHSLEILFSGDQVETSMQIIRKTMSGERWEDVEINILHVNGSIRIVLWNSATIFATDGITPVATIAQGHDITERKRAEEALSESEERFRRAIVDSPFPILLHAEDGTILQTSNSWCEITGYSREELATISDWTERAYGERKTLVQADIDRLYGLKHRVAEGDYAIHTKGGDTRIWEFSSAPLGRLMDGRRIVMSMAMDVTERRRVEEALQESERRLREAQKMAQLGNWSWDIRSGVVEWSEEVYNIFHLDKKEFTPQIDSILAMSPWPEEHERDRELIQKAMECHEKGDYEQRFLRPDGSTGYYYSTFQGKYDAEGNLIAIVGTVLDITERKVAEETLRLAHQRLRRFVDSNIVGIIIASPDGQIVEANDYYLRLIGFTREELESGKIDWRAITPPEWLAVDEQAIRELRERGACTPYEKEYVRRDGSRVPVFLADTLLPGPEEQIAAFALDLTERKAAEAQIQRTMADLERSNQELEQFAYVASHDLQEPLRMVSSYTQLLAQRYEGQLDDKAKKFIDYAVDGAVRMQRLINDLLAYSRVNTQGKTFEMIDSHSVLGEALQNLSSAIEESQAIVSNADLPMVRVDATQLAQLFQNLIGNAIKFRGAESPRIRVSADDLGREWHFSVKDNGIGIDAQYADKVFVIFQRLHTRQEYSGTGIGLAICKRIVERHGGRIWFESEPGNGSTFFFTLPK